MAIAKSTPSAQPKPGRFGGRVHQPSYDDRGRPASVRAEDQRDYLTERTRGKDLSPAGNKIPHNEPNYQGFGKRDKARSTPPAASGRVRGDR